LPVLRVGLQPPRPWFFRVPPPDPSLFGVPFGMISPMGNGQGVGLASLPVERRFVRWLGASLVDMIIHNSKGMSSKKKGGRGSWHFVSIYSPQDIQI